MEMLNIEENNIFEEFDSFLEEEKLTGWSATCLDQTISYYVECNCNEMTQDGQDVNNS
uniref:Conserved_ORF_8 protein n=1 Tax=Titanophycus setchellii TaxID=940129 RepID=A0A1G4NY44_9FLOR|nr:hypothetical protein P8471_pgp137 [Titanophycus setchellii]SCW23572.1 conserved_ORF_8 [Titanophycus setchellii]